MYVYFNVVFTTWEKSQLLQVYLSQTFAVILQTVYYQLNWTLVLSPYFLSSSFQPPLSCFFCVHFFPLRLYPRHASAMNNLGTLTRNPEEAERYYRRALDTNPQHNRALFNLGNLLK